MGGVRRRRPRVVYRLYRPSTVRLPSLAGTESGMAWAIVAHTRKYTLLHLYRVYSATTSIPRRLPLSSSSLARLFPSPSLRPFLPLSVQFNVGYDFELKKRTVKSGEGKKSVKWVTSGAMGTTHRTERIMNIRNDTENEYGLCNNGFTKLKYSARGMCSSTQH
jgi:hypothetical protein